MNWNARDPKLNALVYNAMNETKVKRWNIEKIYLPGINCLRKYEAASSIEPPVEVGGGDVCSC